MYEPPCVKPSEWERPPPADVVIGNGGRVHYGDFSITFEGTDTGKPFDARPPWVVWWRTAVGSFRPATFYAVDRRFNRYASALRWAKGRERARLRRLGGR